ncbi:carcinine transporter-like isoform X2 [Zootermopsis nevadensis]|uniref:carcinine transporter-like isoform X2 n=1 Tax=Zootermopsis nevadensis TaxID=136037 RepID=UPI000B8E2660|nr:carcinine transporter-like isoform X2 [Zootermopsis nevadensis]
MERSELKEKCEEEEEEEDIFDELMEHVGMDGRFQFWFNLIFNMAFVLTVAMPSFNLILAVTLPTHWCHVPGRNKTNYTVAEWKSLTVPRVENSEDSFSKCSMYNLSFPVDVQTPQNLSNAVFKDTESCRHGWDYDTTWYSLTAPSQEDWVCEKEVYVPNTLLVARVGEVVGTLVFGQLGDTIGRRPVLFLGVATLVLGRCVVAFTAGTYVVFLLANFVASLPISVVFQSPLIIGMEISSASQRALLTMLQFVGWTSGMCVMPMVAWATGGEWKLFMVLTSVPCAAVFLAFRQFPESPRWLAAKGKSEKCLEVLNYIADKNGTTLPDNALVKLKELAERKETVYGVATLFANQRLMKNTILISLSLTLTQILYYTIVLSVAGMSGNPFLNFLLQSLIELPGFLIGRALCDRLGRRWSQAGAFVFAGCFQVACLITVVHEHLLWLLVAMVLVVKLSLTVAAYSSYLQCMELYPTCLRQTGTSVGFLIANALGALGPYIVYLILSKIM